MRRLLVVGLIFLAGTTIAAAQSATTVAGRSIEQCVAQLKSTDRVERLRAVRTLGAFGESAGESLGASLDHDDAAVRYLAAVQLGRIGGESLQASRERLQQLAADEASIAVRIAASFALCRSGDVDGHLPFLITSLQHPVRGICCSAAELIGQLGPDASQAVTALEATVEANRPGTRRGDSHLGGAAMNALRKIRGQE